MIAPAKLGLAVASLVTGYFLMKPKSAGAAQGASGASVPGSAPSDARPTNTSATPGASPSVPGLATGSLIPPVDVVSRIATTMATGDPAKFDALADQLQTEGWTAQANDLRNAANQLRSMKATPKAPTTPAATSARLPDLGLPPLVSVPQVDLSKLPVDVKLPPSGTSLLAGKDLAAKVALNVHTTKAGQENKAQIVTFQKAEGLKKVDGKYGSETALAISKYGIVPDKPRHWGTTEGGYNSVVADKQQYRTKLLAIAKTDPVRAEEWARAAKV